MEAVVEKVNKYNLVVIDDEKFICEIIKEILLTEERYHCEFFSAPEKALDYIKTHPVELVLTDFFMGKYSGMDILETTLKYHPEAIVIIMTGHPTIENVISVLKLGAYDYLVKPFKLDTLKLTIERGLKAQRLSKENVHLKCLVSLYQISEAMGSTIHLATILEMVLDSIVNEFNASLVSISLWDPYRESLVLEAFYGSEDEINRTPLLSGRSEINYRVLHDAKPQVINELEQTGGTEENATTYLSQVCHPLLAQGKVIGTLNLLRRDQFTSFGLGDVHLLWILASKAASAIEHSRLYNELEKAYVETVRAFANAVEARDQYTRGHTERVYEIAELIAQSLSWTKEQMKHLYMGCMLHDIGKIGVSLTILNKPGKFTKEEQDIMRKHPETGVKMLEGIPTLEPALPYILYHHEHYDGSGYPLGLKGQNIPIEGRILTIADTVDAILSNRPYRRSASIEKVKSELQRCGGTQFDPELVQLFLKILAENEPAFSEIYSTPEETTKAKLAGGVPSPLPV